MLFVLVMLSGFNVVKGTKSSKSLLGISYCGIYYWLITGG